MTFSKTFVYFLHVDTTVHNHFIEKKHSAAALTNSLVAEIRRLALFLGSSRTLSWWTAASASPSP